MLRCLLRFLSSKRTIKNPILIKIKAKAMEISSGNQIPATRNPAKRQAIGKPKTSSEAIVLPPGDISN